MRGEGGLERPAQHVSNEIGRVWYNSIHRLKRIDGWEALHGGPILIAAAPTLPEAGCGCPHQKAPMDAGGSAWVGDRSVTVAAVAYEGHAISTVSPSEKVTNSCSCMTHR